MKIYNKYIKNYINSLINKIKKIINFPKEVLNKIKTKKEEIKQSIINFKTNIKNKIKLLKNTIKEKFTKLKSLKSIISEQITKIKNKDKSKKQKKTIKFPKIKNINKITEKFKLNNQKKLNKKIANYDISDLSTKKEIFLLDDLTEIEINNFIHISEDAQIIIRACSIPVNEPEYLKKLKEYFKILEKHNRTYNIAIYIENREYLKQSKLLDLTKNINITIYHDFKDHMTSYSKEEYLENDNKLEELIKPIKESNLTPYEKYIAVYNLVKQYKQYQDDELDPKQSRSLKYILDNDFIVCVGYADLLKTLLDKLDIPSLSISSNIDSTNRDGKNTENIPSNLLGHQRNLVKIDDDKYNIHGIYIVDSTFDNHMEYDMYVHSCITFDKQKESNILEELTNEDLLLDFHTFKEFNQKINYYLKREINKSNKDTYQEKIIYEYLFLYYRIMEILIKLDYQEYEYLYIKYNKTIKNIFKEYEETNNSSIKQIEDIFSEFLTEYALYIIPLTNNNIEKDKIYQAATTVKEVIDGFNKEECEEWYTETKEVNEEFENMRFPYIYNPYNKRNNYLTTKSKTLIKTK